MACVPAWAIYVLDQALSRPTGRQEVGQQEVDLAVRTKTARGMMCENVVDRRQLTGLLCRCRAESKQPKSNI